MTISRRIHDIIRNRPIASIVAALLFLTLMAPHSTYGNETPHVDKAIKVALSNGRDTVLIEATSSMGKRLTEWRDSLPIRKKFSVDRTDYAISKLVLFPDGTRINILPSGRIVYRQSSKLLSPQVSAQFGNEDAFLVKITTLLAEIEADAEEKK